jgi:hypothetical protein
MRGAASVTAERAALVLMFGAVLMLRETMQGNNLIQASLTRMLKACGGI